jgi:hypothetical protein
MKKRSMKNKKAAAALAALLLPLSSVIGAEAAKTIVFKGSVQRDKMFEKRVGPDLAFRLNPYEYGWDINVGAVKNRDLDKDYSAVVTPPFRGVNARQIEGWHFRKADNAGGLNAPHYVRGFRFVSTEGEFDRANELRGKYFAFTRNPADNHDAQENLQAFIDGQTSTGTLTITRIELGRPEAGKQAWIESMDFTVSLEAPAAK